MVKPKANKAFIFLAVLMISFTAYSQKGGPGDQEIIKKAQDLFDDENWTEAFPLYAQLVSVYPDNAQYNYKFGVCSLLGSRTDTKRSIRYLSIAYKGMPENKDLLFYLGLAYYQDQEFSTALNFFNRCLEKSVNGASERATLETYIRSCHLGIELVHKNHLDKVISRTEFQYENFHRGYPADEFEGSLIQKPENFTSSRERNTEARSFVYISEPRGLLYYSGYEGAKSDQRDIFKVTLDQAGEWGTPERLSHTINTSFDEDYPVLTNEGNTLYFSSKGHKSIGGYDIFKSEYDPVAKAFGEPENMGIGINSIFDDILYIPVKSGRGAYFASTRESRENNITVFKISLNDGMNEPGTILAKQETTSGEEARTGPVTTSTHDKAMDERLFTASFSAEETRKSGLIAQNNPTGSPSSQETKPAEKPMAEAGASVSPAKSVPPGADQKQSLAFSESSAGGSQTSASRVNKNPIGEAPPQNASNDLRISWELIYSDEEPEEIKPSSSNQPRIPATKPAKQVVAVAFPGEQAQGPDGDEILEISIEPDPLKLVQAVKYATAQTVMTDTDELLEIIVEPDPAKKLAEPVAFHMKSTDFVEEEELEIILETNPVQQVQMVKYSAAQAFLLIEEESLEIFIEKEAIKQTGLVKYAINGGSMVPSEQVKEPSPEAAPTTNRPEPEIKASAVPDEDDSMTASESGLLVFPQPVSLTMIPENTVSHDLLLTRALGDPEGLNYEELLFAASLTTDPEEKLSIYYASFIRAERDWRAYYNASVSARKSADPDQADVYLFQARLIYDEEMVGQAQPEFRIREEHLK